MKEPIAIAASRKLHTLLNEQEATAHGTALEAALARLKEAQEILAEAPDWQPAQERVRDAELALDRIPNHARK